MRLVREFAETSLRIFPLGCLLAMPVLILSSCITPVRYHLAGHPRPLDHSSPDCKHLPTVTVAVGDTIKGVTPARRMGPSGYWTAIHVEGAGTARTSSRDGSFRDGTWIAGVAPGRVEAHYCNAPYAAMQGRGDVSLEQRQNALDYIRQGQGFWVEVVE